MLNEKFFLSDHPKQTQDYNFGNPSEWSADRPCASSVIRSKDQ